MKSNLHRQPHPSSSLLLIAFLALAPVASAQWSGPSSTAPGGGGVTGMVGLSGGSAGVTFNFTVTHLPCVQLYYGFPGNNLKAGIYPNPSTPLTYDPSQTTATQAVWTATLPAGIPGLPSSAPTRCRVTSPTPGVTFLPAPGPIGGGTAVAAIPQDVTSFSINFTTETFYGGNWIGFSLPWNGFGFQFPGPSPLSFCEVINGSFWWYTGGPCAAVTLLPSFCGVATFATTPFTLGTVGAATINGGAPNAPGVVLYSIGPPSPLVIAPCTVYVNLLAYSEIAFTTNAAGSATLAIPLPFNPAFAGLVVTEQAGILNPAAPLGVDITNANQLLVGY
jgi:hypothetical protein